VRTVGDADDFVFGAEQARHVLAHVEVVVGQQDPGLGALSARSSLLVGCLIDRQSMINRRASLLSHINMQQMKEAPSSFGVASSLLTTAPIAMMMMVRRGPTAH
jgi:hypothetical protein